MTSRPEALAGSVILSARGLQHWFGKTHALRGLDLDVMRGEILAIMGPSGSGKSTLLHMLAGVLDPDEGTVEFDGQRVSGLSESQRAAMRLRSFGFVFQFGQLLPDLSALDNVALPLLLQGKTRRAAEQAARECLDALGLSGLEDKIPGHLSGGEAQRVAVARAMATRPKVIFADEPTGSLDSMAAETTMRSLTSLTRASDITLVLVTHDPRTAAYADREIVVRDGRISAGILQVAP